MMIFSNNKKSLFIALVALLVAAIGVLIGLAAYFKNRRDHYLFDEDDDFLFDDTEDLEYYGTDPEEMKHHTPDNGELNY